MPHTWIKNGTDTVRGTDLAVSDRDHQLYYRGQRIREAIYRGNVIWKKEDTEGYDVCFWDWDGTLVAHYSAQSFVDRTLASGDFPKNLHRKWDGQMLAKTNPALKESSYARLPKFYPAGSLLEPDGYNWTDIDELFYFVARYGYADVGLEYKCNGCVAWIAVQNMGDVRFGLYTESDTPITVDFGDGTTQIVDTKFLKVDGVKINSFTASNPITHHYASPGIYVVRVTGTVGFGGLGAHTGDLYSGIVRWITTFEGMDVVTHSMGNIGAGSKKQVLLGIYCGDNAKITVGAFKDCRYCSAIGLGKRCQVNDYASFVSDSSSDAHIFGPYSSIFDGCTNLQHLTIPPQITALYSSAFDLALVSYMDQETYYFWDDAFGLQYEPSNLVSISLPPTWKGPILVPGCNIKQIILPELTEYLGGFVNSTSNFKHLLITSGVFSSLPIKGYSQIKLKYNSESDSYDITASLKEDMTGYVHFKERSADFVAHVPYGIRTEYWKEIADDYENEASWISGLYAYQYMTYVVRGLLAIFDRLSIAPRSYDYVSISERIPFSIKKT